MFLFRKRTDEQLVEQVLGGTRDAYAVLVERYLPVAHAVAYAQLQNAHDAEDIAQESLLKAFEGLGALREGGKFGPWLTTIARNLSRNFQRTRAREKVRHELAAPEEAVAPPDLDRQEIRALLRGQIEELDGAAREILLLHYYAGKRIREIAGILEVSPEAAKKRLQRARQVLSKRLLRELGPATEPETPMKQRVTRVMGIAGGMPVGWEALSTAAMGATAGASAKAATGLLAVKALAVGGAVVVLSVVGVQSVAPRMGMPSKEAPPSASPSREAATGQVEEEQALSLQGAQGERGTTSGPEDLAAGEDDAYVVRGEVRDESGEAVAGAQVNLYHLSGETVIKAAETVSGEAGGFSIPARKGVDYVVAASTAHAIGADTAQAHRASAQDEQTTVTLLPAAPLAGWVRQRDGTPIEGARVTPTLSKAPSFGIQISSELLSLPGRISRAAAQRSDAQGRFRIPLLPKGDWRLEVTAEGYADRNVEWIPAGKENVDVTLQEGGSLPGRVVDAKTGEPVPKVQVQLAGQSKESDGDGRFRFERINDGTYGISVGSESGYILAVPPLPIRIQNGQTADEIVVRAELGGIITGRIYDGVSGEGLEKHLYAQTVQHRGAIKSVTSDKDGHFRIAGLQGGTYEVRVAASHEYAPSPQTIEVKRGESAPKLDFPMRRAVSMAGMVIDAQGAPVADAEVKAQIPRESGSRVKELHSNAEGRFSVGGLEPGDEVRLRATKDGTHSSGWQGPWTVSGSGQDSIRLRLRPMASISGTLVNAAGQAITSSGVHVSWSGAGGSGTTGPDANHEFQIPYLAAGTYELQVTAISLGLHRPHTESVTLAQGQHRTVRIQLEVGGALSISGRVMNVKREAISGAHVSVWGEQGHGHQSLQTDDEGAYEITGLEAGAYHVSVSHGAHSPLAEEAVPAGSTRVDFVLEGCGVVSGRILAANTGRPLPRFEVRTSASSDPGQLVNSIEGFREVWDEAGRFSLAGQTVDTRAVVARAPGYKPGYALVEVIPNGSVENVVLRLESALVLEGRVVNTEGGPVAGASLFLDRLPWPLREPHISKTALAQCGEDGRFLLDMLPDGQDRLGVYHPDYAPIEIDVAQGRGPVEIVLPRGGRVRGTVRVDGMAAADHRIQLTLTDFGPPGNARRVNTDDTGHYAAGRLTPGPVEVVLSLSERHGETQVIFGQAKRNAFIEDGLETVVDFDYGTGHGSTVTGRIDADLLPPGRMVVSMRVVTDGTETSLQGLVEEDGSYRLENVPAGEGRLCITWADDEPGNARQRVVPVTIAHDGHVEFDVSFVGDSRIVGQVMAPPDASQRVGGVWAVPGVLDVAAMAAAGFEGMREQSYCRVGIGGDGSFVIDGLEAGRHTIIAGDTPSYFAHAVVDVPGDGVAELRLEMP